MGSFGISWVGLCFVAALVVPNLLWWRLGMPEGFTSEGENRVLAWFERIGQVAATAALVVFADTNVRAWSPWSWWLIAAVVLMVLYEACWVRYFASPRTMHDFYRPLLGLPIPLAVLPAAAFLALGVYGMLVPLIVAAVIFAVGHIGVHAQHRRRL